MIIDLRKFIDNESALWSELAGKLDTLEADPTIKRDADWLRRFYYLYQRTSADLFRLQTYSAMPEIAEYLESLIARSYSIIHRSGTGRRSFSPIDFLRTVFPSTFRKYFNAFLTSVIITIAGAACGVYLLLYVPQAKPVLLPFEHLQGSPIERVQKEEAATEYGGENSKASFSSFLMTHNIKVSLLLLTLGITFGIGTAVLLFYNGIILGAVAADYIIFGQWKFLLGWLLPHGVIEIPALLIGGQIGLIIAGVLIGYRRREPLRVRLRKSWKDLTVLIAGMSIMLVWAGIVESYLSQYHEPLIPYSVKIAFGTTELLLLITYLALSGRKFLKRKTG